MQLINVALAAAWTLASGEPTPGGLTIAAAAGAGIAITIAVWAFFEAMVIGTMSIVAPVGAAGVVIPVSIGVIFHGERPDAIQFVGLAVVVLGVVLVSRASGAGRSVATRSGLGLAILAAVTSGLFLWLLAPASRGGLAWTVFIARCVPAALLVLAVAYRRPPLAGFAEPRNLALAVVAAVLAFGGLSLYALATLHGALSIVSVLASLAPVVTIVLAYAIIGERLHGAQRVGVVAVLAGVLALSV
jgi:drug/metabolite transporter (DMT)-like permease